MASERPWETAGGHEVMWKGPGSSSQALPTAQSPVCVQHTAAEGLPSAGHCALKGKSCCLGHGVERRASPRISTCSGGQGHSGALKGNGAGDGAGERGFSDEVAGQPLGGNFGLGLQGP